MPHSSPPNQYHRICSAQRVEMNQGAKGDPLVNAYCILAPVMGSTIKIDCLLTQKAIAWAERANVYMHNSPHRSRMDIQHIVFADVVRHGFKPHGPHREPARCAWRCSSPRHSAVRYCSGNEQRQQVTQERAENLRLSSRLLVVGGDQKEEAHTVCRGDNFKRYRTSLD